MAEFLMPSLGADMEAGTLVAWRVGPGDRVRRGDVVAEVDTDKGIIEVEVFADGVVERLLVTEGTKVPVGTPLATLGAAVVGSPMAASTPGPAPPPIAAPAAVTVVAARADSGPATVPSTQPALSPPAPITKPSLERPLASPAARHLARELGVDLATLRGTGPHGSITHADVDRAARARPAAPAPAADAAGRMRQAIAAAMSRSNREIPHYYVTHTIDLGAATSWLDAWNASHSVTERLLPAALLVKAVALSLRQFPELNGRYEGERFTPSPGIHVGMAISLREGGLVLPCIHDADRASVVELMDRLRDLTSRARQGRLRSSELSEGTITITSLGDRGVDGVLGVIYPPQVALVGFGAARPRPWVVDGQVVVRPLLEASLAADHRVSDGHRGARFLATVDQKLSEPERL